MLCPHCKQYHADTARFCPNKGNLIGPAVPGPLYAQPQNPPNQQYPVNQSNPVLQSGYLYPPNFTPSGGLTGQLPPNSFLNNRYIILQKVGQGGMAAVYRAVDTRTNAGLAIKEMSDSITGTAADHAYAVLSFQREATLLASLSHENLPKVTDTFFENNKHYLVMDFVEGVTLGKFLESQGGPFKEPTVVNWAMQLCDVLGYLHTQKTPIIFRDLKPDNVMVTPSGKVKLIDFGIVRFFKSGQRKDTMALGTIGYVAPEAINGQTDSRSDIYSLCATMYYLLTGFDPNNAPLNLRPIRQLNPAISQKMEQILLCGLNSDPNQRFSSTEEMCKQLSGLPHHLSITPIYPGTGSISGPARSSRPTTRLLMAAVDLSLQQILGVLAATVVVLILAAWVLTPTLRSLPVDWNIFPIFALFGPLSYAAYPRRGVGLIAHGLLTTALILTISYRTNMWFSTEKLTISVLTSGLLLEVWLAILPYLKGKGGQDAWKIELAWYAGLGAPFVLLFFYILDQGLIGMNPITWLFGAGFTALAWFLGDLINQYLLYRQYGVQRSS